MLLMALLVIKVERLSTPCLHFQMQSQCSTKEKLFSKPRKTATAAGIALVLAIFALFAAIVAIYFAIGFQGTNSESANEDSSQEHLQQISNLQQMIQTLKDELNSLQSQLNNKSADQDAAIAALTNTLARNLGTFWNPVRSCSDVPPGSSSSNYWVQTSGTNNPVQVYCDMNRTSCSCNTTGVWMRVANLDMTDSNQNCPPGFRLVNRTSAPLRICGRPGQAGCVSAIFRTYGVEYSHVCGRVIGYQGGTPDAFGRDGSSVRGNTIDSIYVDGVSLTHGQSPRQHIWTFAAALDEMSFDRSYICPCTQSDIPDIYNIPSFVEQDYFCDTGSSGQLNHSILYADDPLWDGKGCGITSTCCEFNTPPWFCKQLSQPTTDDIELRICGSESTSNEDTPIEQVEIYIR